MDEEELIQRIVELAEKGVFQKDLYELASPSTVHRVLQKLEREGVIQIIQKDRDGKKLNWVSLKRRVRYVKFEGRLLDVLEMLCEVEGRDFDALVKSFLEEYLKFRQVWLEPILIYGVPAVTQDAIERVEEEGEHSEQSERGERGRVYWRVRGFSGEYEMLNLIFVEEGKGTSDLRKACRVAKALFERNRMCFIVRMNDGTYRLLVEKYDLTKDVPAQQKRRVLELAHERSKFNEFAKVA